MCPGQWRSPTMETHTTQGTYAFGILRGAGSWNHPGCASISCTKQSHESTGAMTRMARSKHGTNDCCFALKLTFRQSTNQNRSTCASGLRSCIIPFVLAQCSSSYLIHVVPAGHFLRVKNPARFSTEMVITIHFLQAWLCVFERACLCVRVFMCVNLCACMRMCVYVFMCMLLRARTCVCVCALCCVFASL